MKNTIRSLLVAAILTAVSLQARAQGFIYDQESATNPVTVLGNGNADGLDIQEDSPLMQSFVPTLSDIGVVQLEFADIPGNGNNGATLYVNIWTGSPNTNSATLVGTSEAVYMSNGFSNSGLGVAGVTNFYFANPIILSDGQTYYIQPVVESGDNPWDVITIGDTYPNGQLYIDNLPYGTDMYFREGILATPEPSPMALTSLGSGLFFILKRRSDRTG